MGIGHASRSTPIVRVSASVSSVLPRRCSSCGTEAAAFAPALLRTGQTCANGEVASRLSCAHPPPRPPPRVPPVSRRGALQHAGKDANDQGPSMWSATPLSVTDTMIVDLLAAYCDRNDSFVETCGRERCLRRSVVRGLAPPCRVGAIRVPALCLSLCDAQFIVR